VSGKQMQQDAPQRTADHSVSDGKNPQKRGKERMERGSLTWPGGTFHLGAAAHFGGTRST
jgi:hypothetical protein